MRDLLNSLVGKLVGSPAAGSAGVSPRLAGEFADYFHILKLCDASLPRKVAAYVASGEGGSVLSTLATQAVQAKWRNRGSRERKHPLRAAYARDDSDAAIIRFGEVMAALEPPQNSNAWSVAGTSASPDWLRHAAVARHDVTIYDSRVRPLGDTARIARLAAVGGATPLAVLDILFHQSPGSDYRVHHSLDLFPGARDWLAANVADVREHQAGLDAPGRVELAQAIGQFGLVDAYLDLLLGYGASSAKTVRAAAAKALTGAPRDRLADALAARYGAAGAAERTELVGLAVATLGSEAGALLAQWRETETEKKPREAIERATANVALSAAPKEAEVGPWERGYVALDGSTVALPPRVRPPEPSPVPREALELIRPSIASYNACLRAMRESKDERYRWARAEKPLDDSDLAEFKRIAEGGKPSTSRNNARDGVATLNWGNYYLKFDQSGVQAFYAHPGVTLRHLIAVLRNGILWHFLPMFGDGMGHLAARELRRRVTSAAEFQQAADLWTEVGGKPPVREYLELHWDASLDHVDAALLWPVVAESLDILDEAFGLRPQSQSEQLVLRNALDLLGVLPKVPNRYLLPLMTLATGTQKTHRQRARALLGGAPEIDAAIEGLLGDGKQEVRAGAAEWLASRGTASAIPALRKVLAKEKSDIARAALLTALEKLGDDVSDAFDPARVLDEAKAGLAKTPAKGLEWFPFDLLPRLAWADGAPLDPVIVRWWVVLANKLKLPGGNPLLDLWLDRLRPEDARQLSLFVLRSWIEQDTRAASDDEANAYAASLVDAQLQQNRQWARQYPKYAEYYVTDRDLLFAQIKRQKLGEYLGSANDSKGVLALATHAGGADAAALVRGFLKDHGRRVSQDKALLDMLAANPAPAAIQVVLATANRFKARTVQEHAAALVAAIAERRGWTPEELADRTIPSAGLDERGEAELDCGEGRTYVMALDATDALVLRNPAGQLVKALPAERHPDEKPLIAEAKKQLANARKEAKQVFAAQTERLFEAMCLERRWRVEDWEPHLLRHPIVGRLLRRTVWIGLDREGARAALFRPLDDGSFTDVADNDVALGGFAEVQLAHASLVSPEEAAAWRTHLADYEVAAPFDQFATDLPELPESMRDKTAIDDRTGWMIENFKLRGAAGKRGYTRGAAEDGGVFTTYERRYDSAGLVVMLEFTGSPLPEENIPTALRELRFVRARRGRGWYGEGVALKEVPPVLLAEAWKDLHAIAAAGTGFDADWEKKAGW